MMANRRENYFGAERVTFMGRHALSAIDLAGNFVFTIGCILCALFVSIYSSAHSADADEYRRIYDAIVFGGESVEAISRKEILYYLWNSAVGVLGISFEAFLFISTLIFLPLKLMAFKQLSRGVGLGTIWCIYVALYFFLHESIQYKISWALAFAAWACVLISRKLFLRAAALTVLGAGFHVTSILLPLTFFLSMYVLRGRGSKFGFILILMLLYPFASLFADAGGHILGMYDPRYLDYLSSGILEGQNKTGLFCPYVMLMLMFVAYILTGVLKFDSEKLRAQAFVLCISVGVLILFSGYVSMASRLSDVLAVLFVPVLAALFVRPDVVGQLQKYAIFIFCAVLLFFRLGYVWGWRLDYA